MFVVFQRKEKGAAVCVPVAEYLPKVLTKALIKVLIPITPASPLHHGLFALSALKMGFKKLIIRKGTGRAGVQPW